MNQEQKEFIKRFLHENEFEIDIGDGWGKSKAIHSSKIVYIYKQLKNLEK